MTADSWSVHSRLLPYLEQQNLQDLIDWNASYNLQPQVAGTKVPNYVCPSDVNDQQRVKSSGFTHYPTTYGANLGVWFVYNPISREGGDGMTSPTSRIRMAAVIDGTSNTLAFAEVKAYQPYLRDAGSPSALNAPIPLNPADVVSLGGDFKTNTGHTEWVDSRAHQTGVTATFAPNTLVEYNDGGAKYDVDFNSRREGKTVDQLTYASVTSRSYHPGGVQVLLIDGSARFVAESIQLSTWRGLATRNGAEILGEF